MAQKKVRSVAIEEKREWVEAGNGRLSIVQQCELADLSRSGLYYSPKPETKENLRLMRRLDEQYTRTPFYGVMRMTEWLRREGCDVNPKRVRRLLRQMGLEAIYAKPRLSVPAPGHRIYPYRLRGLPIVRPNQVWGTDITYIRMRRGFAYLVAIMDWFSRYVLSWELSVTLDVSFCVAALQWALKTAQPEIFNSDQGSQFTSEEFTKLLLDHDVEISMDGRGRAMDNIFVERLWRSVKYEEVYLKDYEDLLEAVDSLRNYFLFYNGKRIHQSLAYQTPAEVYFQKKPRARITGNQTMVMIGSR